MDFQGDTTLRLTRGMRNVDEDDQAPRGALIRGGISVGNKATAEEVIDIAAEGFTPALLACNGRLPSWWDDHEARNMPAIALGFDDLEVNHPVEKTETLNIGASFIGAMLDAHYHVLIYCCHGSSRSVVMAAYHLVLAERLSPAQALEEVMDKVEWAAPSLGMIELLVRASSAWMSNRGR